MSVHSGIEHTISNPIIFLSRSFVLLSNSLARQHFSQLQQSPFFHYPKETKIYQSTFFISDKRARNSYHLITRLGLQLINHLPQWKHLHLQYSSYLFSFILQITKKWIYKNKHRLQILLNYLICFKPNVFELIKSE